MRSCARSSLARWTCSALLVLAAPAAASGDRGFGSHPTDQLGVPGFAAGAEVTPEGSVFGGFLELGFAFGEGRQRWRQPHRELEDGRLPVLRSTRTRDGVRHSLALFADDVGGVPAVLVRTTLRNLTREPVTARWAYVVQHAATEAFRFPRPAAPPRPGLYEQPGAAFDPTARWEARDGLVLREGRVVAVLPPGGRAVTSPPVAPDTEVVRDEHAIELEPGGTAALDAVVPLEPPAAEDALTIGALRAARFDERRSAVAARARAVLDRAMALAVPEPRVADAYAASLLQILLARHRTADGQWVQAVNKLQYHAFWLRDAAAMAHALDLAGLHAEAAEDLAFFAAWQGPDGHFISRPGQLDGHGQALWALGRHARLARDAAFAASWLPRVAAALDWLDRERGRDPDGLLPPSDPMDNEDVAGRLAGDAFWAVAGVAEAVRLARLAGDEALADRAAATRDALRGAVVRAVRRAAAGHGRGAIPPALDRPGGRDWGNLWAAWPVPVLGPRDPLVRRTLARVRARYRGGLPRWERGLHGYLGFRVAQTELLQGEADRAADGLYAALAHTTATHGGFETGGTPRPSTSNLTPHGWFAAELVTMLRAMLVQERRGGVELLGGVPARWLRGAGVALRRAPVPQGVLDAVVLRPVPGGARLRWSARLEPGTRLWLRVPRWARDVRVGGRAVAPGERVALPGPSGTLRVHWARPPAGPSLARAAARAAAARG